MRNPRYRQLSALLLVAACGGGESTIVEVEVADVTVSPSAATVEVGLTVQFSASAADASGAPVTGQEVTWESGTQSVATITADGLATGVQVGSTEISATVDGVTGSQTLTVQASPCTTRTQVVLAPGEYATFQGNDCLLLPAGSVGDLYRVAVVRPTLIRNVTNTPSVTLQILQVLTPAAAQEAPLQTERTAAAPRQGAVLPRMDWDRALEHLRWQDATRAFHIELRTRERTLGLDASALLPSSPAGIAAAPPLRVDPPATDSMFLELDCTATEKEEVTLISFSDNIALYQETADYDSDPISTDASGELIEYYDLYVRDMVVDYWGALPDADADGRVTVVTTPALGENVAAAVFSGDFYQSNGPEGCTGSNEGETIYFSADLLRDLAPATGDPDYFALGVVAHEAKHVISLYKGIVRGDPGPAEFHDLWIEEGTAEVSQEMSSRIAWAATGGPAVGAPITRDAILTAVQANGGQPTKEMVGIIDVLAGTVRSLSGQPNSVTVDPNGAPEGHSFYANSWHWHRFLGDGFGDASTPYADSAFFRALTDPGTPAGAAAGEILLTGRGTFEQLFEDFVVAVSFHGSPYTPTYPIDTWDLVDAGDVFRNPNPAGSYPWPVTATETTDGDGNVLSSQQWAPFANDSFSGTMGPAGVRFHDFRSSGFAAVEIQVAGSSQLCDEDNTVRCDRIIVSRLD